MELTTIEGSVIKECVIPNIINMREALEICKRGGIKLKGLYIKDEDLGGIDLSGMDLSKAYIFDTDLSFSNMSDTNLSYSIFNDVEFDGVYADNIILNNAKWFDVKAKYISLYDANMQGMKLGTVDFRFANLDSVNLQNSTFDNVNLEYADLTNADLQNASIYHSSMNCTTLTNANLRNAEYKLFEILQINIGDVSPELKLELMRWDAQNYGIEKMNKWAESASFDYPGSLFNFAPDKSLWKSGKPKCKSLMELWQWITEELNIKI